MMKTSYQYYSNKKTLNIKNDVAVNGWILENADKVPTNIVELS
jgi:hypothetical protein